MLLLLRGFLLDHNASDSNLLFLGLLLSALPVLSDVASPPRFLVDVFSFVIHAEFEVGVLAPGEFRWKIFLGEDLEPLVVLVCHLHGKLFVIHRW